MTGDLRAVLESAAEAAGLSRSALTVLSDDLDPYRWDRPAARRDAEWFAAQLDRVSPGALTIHLRGLHYRLCGLAVWPDGTPYVNGHAAWKRLGKASQAARWLGLVEFARIIDQRNDRPQIFVPEGEAEPGFGNVSASLARAEVPYLPDPELFGAIVPSHGSLLAIGQAPRPRQPYRLCFIGEKSSLRDELLPLVRMVGGELCLLTGDSSDTYPAEIADRAVADGRPIVIFYFCDYDPSGWGMPRVVARKMQAHRDLRHAGLRVRVYRVALTLQQCLAYDLPSSPLKESELRADNWRAMTGREQTEIDGLAALHPGAIRQIAEEFVKPFYDPGLDDRAHQLRRDWEVKTRQRLHQAEGYEQACAVLDDARDRAEAIIEKPLAAAREAITTAREALTPAVEEANEILAAACSEALALLPLDLRQAESIPLPEPDLPPAPEPLYDSDDDYTTATLRLIADKKAAGGDA